MNTYAELEEKQYSISNLISNSKITVLGKANEIKIEANNYLIEFEIEQSIFGNRIAIISSIKNLKSIINIFEILNKF